MESTGEQQREVRLLDLERITDRELLELRLSDLPVGIQGTRLEQRLNRLYCELDARALHFRPHVWLSEEWFTPDGVGGFAIPFYLTHSRLIRLERSQMLEVEGAGEGECMRILRHEAGHAINNAFRLHTRRSWTETFGSYRVPYPDWYQPKPNSQEYVLNLDAWYAQAHPAEDFAETFAVWLKSGRWRRHYEGWPALRKLQYVDQVMGELTHSARPIVMQKREIDPLRRLTKTLGEHYQRKRAYYAIDWPAGYDSNLYRIFSRDPRHRSYPTAAKFLRRVCNEVCRVVALGTGIHHFTINYIMKEMIDRCRELDLRVAIPEGQAKRLVIVALTMQTMQVLQTGYHRIPL